MTDKELLRLAERICTPKEYEAFALWHRGAGYRRIADQLGISFSTTRDRVSRALRKLRDHPDTQESTT